MRIAIYVLSLLVAYKAFCVTPKEEDKETIKLLSSLELTKEQVDALPEDGTEDTTDDEAEIAKELSK